MTFDKDYLSRISSTGTDRAPIWRSYVSAADTLATIIASGYFNDKILDWKVTDVIGVQGTNGYGLYKITSVTTNVTLESFDISEGDLDLTYGSIYLGDASAKAVELVIKTDTQIIVGNGTTATSVAMSGDATLANTGALTIAALAIDNAKVATAAAIDYSKLAALAQGSILLGSAGTVATVTDFSTDTQFGVGNGTTFASVAMSGDATLANTGAVTIAALAIDNGKVATAAAIAWSKMAALTDAQFLVGSGTNVATDVAMSGDATLANTGALTIAALAIDNGKVATAAAIDYSKLAALAQGSILLGSAGTVATVTDVKTDTQILVGNGTTIVSVAVSGDATLANTGALTIGALAIDNSKVATAAAIAWSKMAALTDTNILVGNGTNVATDVAMSGDATIANTGAVTIAALAIDNGKVATAAAIAWTKMAALTEGNLLLGDNSNVAVVTDFSANAQIGVGDGTTFASVAVSGDIAIDNAGATTIQASAVDEAMINPNTLTGLVAANVADANVIGGIPVLFRIDTAGGATANTDVTVTHKIRVIDAWVVNTGLGTAGDTIQLFNGANNITDAIDINTADMTIGRATTIDDSYHDVAASGTLRVTETDGGGTDSPSTIVYVSAIRVA